MRDEYTGVMRIVATDHFFMKRMLNRMRAELLDTASCTPERFISIVRAMRFHIDYVLEAHSPIEEIIFRHLRTRRSILASTVDDLLLDHAKAESWLLAIDDLTKSDGFKYPQTHDRLRRLILNYSTHKLAHIEKEDHKILPAINAIFRSSDWETVKVEADKVLMTAGKIYEPGRSEVAGAPQS